MSALVCRSAPGNNIPERMKLSDAEPWMADALNGVGPKSKLAVAEQLRTQQVEKLPKRARDMVPELFIVPDVKIVRKHSSK